MPCMAWFPSSMTLWDPDAGDGAALKYTLTCPTPADCAFFTLKSELDASLSVCARIYVAQALDFETKRAYTLTLRVADRQRLTAAVNVTIRNADLWCT